MPSPATRLNSFLTCPATSPHKAKKPQATDVLRHTEYSQLCERNCFISSAERQPRLLQRMVAARIEKLVAHQIAMTINLTGRPTTRSLWTDR